MTRIESFTNDGLHFPVRDSGPVDGPIIVLLHGFPQSARIWDETAHRLNTSGYRTLAPDQRGYAPQAAPARRGDYRIERLTGDIAALVEHAGPDPVHLVGHDWGSAVAWTLTAARPDLVASLTAISVPHPLAFATSMVCSRQLLRSWYMLLFQLPWIPELLIGRVDTIFYRMLRRTGHRPAAARRDIAGLQQPGIARGALNWYRALPYALKAPAAFRRPVTAPTLQIWSDGDTAVGRKAHELTRRWVNAPLELVTLPGISHWVPDEVPDQLASMIVRHVSSQATAQDGCSAG